MTQIFSIKSAAVLCVAAVTMCFAGQDASAQCLSSGRGVGFGPGVGFGGSALNIGYTSGYRGINYGGFGYGGYGGINRGVSINLYRPSYGYSVYRPSAVYGGVYGRPYGNVGRGHGHGNYHRHW